MSNAKPLAPIEKFMAARPLRPTIDEYAATLEAQGRVTPVVQEALDKARAVRLGHNLVFYIAGPLTGVSEEIKLRYVALSELIAGHKRPDSTMFGYAPHLYGTDPVKHPAVTPEEVRDVDYLWAVIVPDGHFNSWEPVAHGNAIEEGWAEAHGIPAIYLTPSDMLTSRLVRGMHNIVDTITYADFHADVLPQLATFLDEVASQWPSRLQ